MKSIIIHEFMINELKLSGIKLLLYALIYSFTQFGQGFFPSDKLVCKFLGISRSQFFQAKKYLIENNLIQVFDGKLFAWTQSDIDPELDLRLDEMIRIAKTPWLE